MSAVHKKAWSITPNTGGTIDIANVIGRHDVIASLVTDLTTGESILMVDPRRMGKTSILKQLCASPGDELDAVWVDLEGANTVEECFARIARALRSHADLGERIKKPLLALIKSVELDTGLIKINPTVADKSFTELLSDLVQGVSQKYQADNQRLVIALDEVPLAVRAIANNESTDAAVSLVQTLRHLRSQAEGVGWILAGSVGFHHVLEEIGLTDGALNDLKTVAPGPLDTESARLLSECLMLGIDRTANDDALKTLIDTTGGFPFIIHQIANRLDTKSKQPVTSEEIETAFEAFASDLDDSKAWTHLLSRLDTKELTLILDHLAINEPQTLDQLTTEFASKMGERDTVLDLLNHLRLDHYLERTPDRRYGWKYDVLRRFWVIRRDLTS